MSERLTDERIDFYAAFESDKGALAREVQQRRALIPDLIEQLEAIRAAIITPGLSETRRDLLYVVARLREASQ